MPLEGKLRDTKSILQGLLDNKTEYTDHLCEVLAEPMLRDFHGAYEKLRTSPDPTSGARVVRGTLLNKFQSWLVDVAGWNAAQIRETYQQVVKRSGCAYIPDLVKGILITYVKIQMVSHGRGRDAGKIKLRVPSPENFLHACYIAAARALWKRPYLFYHEVRSLERQQNLLVAEDLIRQAVKRTLRGFVPMDQLMSQLQSEDIPDPQTLSEEEPESESESESASEEESESESESEEESASASGSESESESNNAGVTGGAESPESSSESEEPEDEMQDENVGKSEHSESDSEEEAHALDVPEDSLAKTQEDNDASEFEESIESEDIPKVPMPNTVLNHDSKEAVKELEPEPEPEVFPEVKSIAVSGMPLNAEGAHEVVQESEESHEESTVPEAKSAPEPEPTELTNKIVPLGNMLVNRTKLHRPKLHKSNLLRQSLKRTEDTFF